MSCRGFRRDWNQLPPQTGGLSITEQIDLTATRPGETGRQPVIERDDFPVRLHNLQSCLADGRLIGQFILAEKSA
jgi:hypothetical protein